MTLPRALAALLVVALGRAAGQSLFPDAEIPLPGAAGDLWGGDVAGGDLDGDGDRDLAVLNPDGNQARFLSNDGAGRFTLEAGKGVLPRPFRIRLADGNGDGTLDAFVAAWGNTPATGGFTFVYGSLLSTSILANTLQFPGSPNDLAVADVNLDGALDVVAANGQAASLVQLHGNGFGGFSVTGSLPLPSFGSGVDAGDVDGDGDADLVATAPGSSLLRLFANDVGSGWAAPADFAVGPSPGAVLLAPLDGDALADALVSCKDGGLRLLRADGAGGLLPAVAFTVEPDPSELVAADLDFDGDLDVAAAHRGTGIGPAHQIHVLRSDGAGQLAPSQSLRLSIGDAANGGVDLGDLDGDLLPDAVGSYLQPGLFQRAGDGLCGFDEPPVTPIITDAITPLVADLTGDGQADLLVLQAKQGSVQVQAGAGDGSFAPAFSVSTGNFSSMSDVALADITLDGEPDLVALFDFLHIVTVVAGNGAGGFAAPVASQTAGTAPIELATADVDLDGAPDVLVANRSNVAVLRNAAGVLQAAVTTSVPQATTALAVGHVDGDAAPDVVVASQQGAGTFTYSFTLLRGDGAGGWLAPKALAGDAGRRTEVAALADLDADGFDDLVTLSTEPSPAVANAILAVRRSNGVDGFLAAGNWTMGANGSDLLVRDFDGDDDRDVFAALSGNSSRAALRRGTAGIALSDPAEVFLRDFDPKSLAAGDVDADGWADVVALSPTTHQRALTLRNLSGGKPWSQLGHALAGDAQPKLTGAGALVPGTPGQIVLFGAPPLAAGALFFATASTPAPFKGGTLVPFPPGITSFVVVPSSGRINVAWAGWPPVGSGSSFFFQAAVVDGGAPKGVALSGALGCVTP